MSANIALAKEVRSTATIVIIDGSLDNCYRNTIRLKFHTYRIRCIICWFCWYKPCDAGRYPLRLLCDI